MRTRFTMRAALLCGVAVLAVPAVANAAPHHNRGLTINVTPNPIISGQGVLIYGAGSPGQTVYLYHRINPASRFSLISVTKTSALGFYEFTRAEGIVLTNRSWFVRGSYGTHSRTIHERVASLVSLAESATSVTTAQPVTFTGSVSPNHPFQRVILQTQGALNGNGWRTVEVTRTDGASQFSLAHRFRVPGDYTLRAVFGTDPRNVRGESDSVTLSVQQAQVPGFTITSSAPIVTEGNSVTISGVLDAAGSSTPMPSTQVTLYGRQDEGPVEALATTVTGTDGSYGFTETPVHNTVYYVGETLKPKRHSARLFEGVQDAVTILAGSPTTTVGGTVTITGAVSPDKTGHLIWLQRQGKDGAWHDVAQTTVGTGSSYAFTYTPGQAGTVELRARIYGGPENVGAASPAVMVTVTGLAPVATLPPAS